MVNLLVKSNDQTRHDATIATRHVESSRVSYIPLVDEKSTSNAFDYLLRD